VNEITRKIEFHFEDLFFKRTDLGFEIQKIKGVFMKSVKGIFMIGILSLASMGLFVIQNEARAATSGTQITECDTSSTDVRQGTCIQGNDPFASGCVVTCTIHEGSQEKGKMEYGYGTLFSTGELPVRGTYLGMDFGFTANTSCKVAVTESNTNMLLWSHYYPDHGTGIFSNSCCRCANLYGPVAADGIPREIISGFLQIAINSQVSEQCTSLNE
jgi:hypothetical protein